MGAVTAQLNIKGHLWSLSECSQHAAREGAMHIVYAD